MLDLATKNDLPLIFHVRDAFDDFFAVLDNFHNLRGVVHSFSDTPENLKKSLARGFYIGVNGLATFANLPLPPLEKTLLETDSPFLAPVPFRGKVNDPSHIKDIALWLADKHQASLDDIANTTVQNAKNLFNI
jgi:TatD DNase family protein